MGGGVVGVPGGGVHAFQGSHRQKMHTLNPSPNLKKNNIKSVYTSNGVHTVYCRPMGRLMGVEAK